MHFAKFLKGLDTSILNKGTELIVTIKGDKEKLMEVEKKLGAIKELCSEDGGCCGGGCGESQSDGHSDGGCC